MADQHGSGSGPDDSSRGDSSRDDSAWAEASREMAEQDRAGSPAAGTDGPAADSGESAATGSAGEPSGGTTDAASAGPRRAGRPGQDRRQSGPRPATPGADMISDFQRWLLRSSAKSMRKELTGQVRRTLGGGRAQSADVWDTATSEIPPEVGESPECQWCPVCRAARRMRDSGPSLGDHLSSASDAVAAAVSEALKTFDSVVSRAAGSAGTEPRPAPPDSWAASDGGDWSAARDRWAAAHGGQVVEPGVGEAPPDTTAESADQGGQDASQQTEGPDEPDNRG